MIGLIIESWKILNHQKGSIRGVIEIRFNRGLHLPELDLWLDPWDAKPWAFVSHAHADHFARHDAVCCSEITAYLLEKRFRMGSGKMRPMPFHETIEVRGFRLRMLPAGHIFGSAMLHVTRLQDQATLLYTGDFKMRKGKTSEAISLLRADQLVMETTFGLPQWVFPPAMEIESKMLRFVEDALADGDTPVFFGYALGKAQEAQALFAEHGIPVMLHPTVAAMSTACRDAGLDILSDSETFAAHVPAGHVLIAPPNAVRSRAIRNLRQKRTAMLTGWALQPGAKFRYQVDECFPLSDHADYPSLLDCVQRVHPQRVLTIHGYTKEFAADLRFRGIDAWSVNGADQLDFKLFPQTKAASTAAKLAPRHQRPICGLADLSDLCRLIAETNSRLAKIDYLANYFKQLEDNETLGIAARWLGGEIFSRASGHRALRVGTAQIRQALLAVRGAREERYREISLAQNDMARTARLLLQELHLQAQSISLLECQAFFQSLLDSSSFNQRMALLSKHFEQLHPAESETIVRLITGDLRIGLKASLVEDAIADAFSSDVGLVRRAHMLTGDLGETAVFARHGTLESASLRPLVPIRPMLASPLERDEDDQLPMFESLPFEPPYWLEPKYDGIRVQLHKVGKQAALFSRDLRRLDHEFPEIITAALSVDDDFICDGELIAYAQGRKLGFADLQKRLSRKMAESDLFLTSDDATSSIPLRLIAFDLLWHQQLNLLDQPLHERRQRLTQIDFPKMLEAIPCYRTADVNAIVGFFKTALQNRHEGLIAKDPNSFYSPGKRGKSWIKLKGVMPTLDCVVTHVEQGHGKRAEVLSDYTFAVRDEPSGKLLTLGKAYTGLTDEELENLTDHFKKITLRKERRKCEVVPEVIIEVAFDSIRASKRHDSGLALRFPRIKCVRHDKTLAEIDTLQTARSLVQL